MTTPDEAVLPWRLMYDSVNPEAVPVDAEMVGGYVDGRWAWPADAWDQWPHAAKVRVSNVMPHDIRHCSVADVETGALTIADAPSFVRQRNAFRPGTASIYCSEATLPFVGKACAGLDYWVWVAWWNGYPSLAEVQGLRASLRPGVKLAAIQYRNDAAADVDLSAVFEPGWHPKP